MARPFRLAFLRSFAGIAALAATALPSAAAFAATSVPQSCSLDVATSSTVYAMDDAFEFAVTGANVVAATPVFEVFLDEEDVTQDVFINTLDESFEAVDGQGIAAEYAGSYELDLSAVTRVHGRTVTVVAYALSSCGAIDARDGVRLRRNIRMIAPDSIDEDSDSLEVHIRLDSLRLQSQSFSVKHNGVDVTSVALVSLTTAAESVDSSGFIQTRTLVAEIDLGSLSPSDDDTLEFAYAAVSPSAAYSSVVVLTRFIFEAIGGGLGPCYQSAAQAFAAALGLNTSGGVVTSSASASDVAAAADTLSTAWAACGGSSKSVTITVSTPGGPVTVQVGARSSGGNCKVTGSADVVVAVSGDGNGGNAEASTSAPGGMAVAVGGAGQSGASPAKAGGNATAEGGAGGSALAVGGQGGAPGNPANPGGNGGTATTGLAGSVTSSTQAGGAGTTGAGGQSSWSKTTQSGNSSGLL